jgi:hypothetical protein
MTALTAELGDRAAAALRAENVGLTCQRLNVIRDRTRFPQSGWRVQYDDGIPVRMVWWEWQ